MKVKNADVLSKFVVIVYIHMGVIVTQEDPQSALFVNCSYRNGMCDWESISAGWKIGQGSSTTSGTGSAHDHALGNASRIYTYLDPKSVNTSQSHFLRSPLIPWSCLSLWNHICGKGTGKLTVSIEKKETTTATKFRTTQSGNRTILRSHEGKLDDKWDSVEITIQTQEAFRVLLVGTRKRQNGAIAVDDNQLSKCCCKDNCAFGFCNWLQMTSVGFRWIDTFGVSLSGTTGKQSSPTNKTTGQQSGRKKRKTSPQRGSTNKTKDTQSGHTKKTTGPQSGCTNKTTEPPSGRTNKTTDPPRGLTNKTTEPPTGRTNKTTYPPSGRTNKTTDPPRDLTNKTTKPPSGRTNKTTDPPSGRTNKTTDRPKGLTNKTIDRPSGRTKTITGQQNGRTNKTTDPQSGRTNKTSDPPSGRTNKTTNTPSDPTNKTGKRTTSTTGDLKESTFSVGWEDAYTKTTKPAQITTQGHIPEATVGVITVGAVIFVVLSLLVGVWICRKRRRHRKKVEPFELQPIASKPSSIADERGYSSSAAHCINPCYTHSSNVSRSGNKALINDKTDDANYEYASAFQSTPAQWTDDTYDTTGDKAKPRFYGAYDHIQTHFDEEYDATHLTIRTRLDACEIYDHVTICSDDVYGETCVAQASTIQYKSYDHVTKGTCETPVSQQNIINSQDNIYELVE